MSDSNNPYSGAQTGQNDAYYGKSSVPPTNVSAAERQNYENAYAWEQQRLAELRKQHGQG